MSLAERLKSARENAGLKQKQVSQKCGIDDSSLSAFENGRSEPRLAQLAKLAEIYHVSLSYFFGETGFQRQFVMWRHRPEDNKEIEAEFLNLCRQYRQLEIWTNEVREKQLPVVNASAGNFGYPHVIEVASATRCALGLGDRPGESLYRILEEVYSIKIFHMDLEKAGIAACAVSDEFGEAILLNKKCSRWRRNHDLAHELFHLLTWQQFGHAEGICDPAEQEEKFATCFAGNLLLPTDVVSTTISKASDAKDKISWNQLDRIAREFDVSLESLLWRMHFLYNWEEAGTLKYIEVAKEYVKAAERKDESEPPLFPERYQALAIKALLDGEISLGRFAKFMRISRMEAEDYLVRGQPADAGIAIPTV